MSIQDYNSAVKLIQENQELADFVGNCPEMLIKKAEEKLNIVFPQSYRSFLLSFGAGNFGAEEIYGIIKEDFDNSGIPDAIWFTLKQRKEINLPSNLVIIYHTGGEEMFCLDINKIGKHQEPIIVSYAIGTDLKHQIYEMIANDFGEFFLQRIKLELGIS
ncbi:SMI1/KNR4 family protein [Candidatus Formimonas warabiya]|uniref:Cell wall assembly protein n=1 Tax=Formimonas warabiya TaxID=1761012 RepID=A0A3G1KS52_FORW1|nr:SMI1/KNR4 family protein [Candidatus Formimonas warabiya]ATW25299.1 cell wall assembly protein [Candidatus Formimonas warabiya]